MIEFATLVLKGLEKKGTARAREEELSDAPTADVGRRLGQGRLVWRPEDELQRGQRPFYYRGGSSTPRGFRDRAEVHLSARRSRSQSRLSTLTLMFLTSSFSFPRPPLPSLYPLFLSFLLPGTSRA